MKRQEQEGNPYRPRRAKEIGIFGLDPLRNDVLAKLAHRILSYRPYDQVARRIVHQFENGASFQDATVDNLLESQGVTELWATLYVRNGKMDSRVQVTAETPERVIIRFAKKALIRNRVDPY